MRPGESTTNGALHPIGDPVPERWRRPAASRQGHRMNRSRSRHRELSRDPLGVEDERSASAYAEPL